MEEKRIGDYRIIKEFAKGALGSSFLVEHRFIKKEYMLTLLPKELSLDESFIKRFSQEVARLATIEHPNIVKIYNVSSIEGSYFLVTDAVINSKGESTSLKDIIAETPLTEEEILSFLRQIAAALDYAHSLERVHGLLMLQNILVDRSQKKLALTEYGLMSIVGEKTVVGRVSKEFATAHAFLESFAFLAPEQKQLQPATIKSDSYAFGVIAYYLLRGHFPEGHFPMPSESNKGYHFNFDKMLCQCLAYDPEKRPEKLLPLLEEKAKSHFTAEVRQEEEASLPEKATTFKESIGSYVQPKKSEKVEGSQVAAVAVAPKNVAEATPQVLNPPKDENYTEALKSMLHRDPVVTHYQPKKRTTDNLEPIHSEMVVIEGGQFIRGSNEGARDEAPQHQVSLLSFAIDIHPITNAQFVRFLEYMGGEKDEEYNDLIRLKESRINRTAGSLSIESGYAKHPVVGVTWYGASAYAKWVKKRLPTEAEWEVAASGGLERTLFPTGETIEKSQANFFSSDTTAVMSYAPNGYGLYDMVGNVYEWVQDWYGYNYYETSEQEPKQPLGPQQGVYRVLRGGCWKSLHEDLRIAHRHRNNPGTVNGTYGFRCAQEIK